MRAIYIFIGLLFLAGPGIAFIDPMQQLSETEEFVDLPGMSIAGDKYMTGVDESKGVKGVVYLNDLREEMEKYGLQKTHHMMVEFSDAESGQLIDVGSAAVKITAPDGATGDTIKLTSMAGGFGADVKLNEGGLYSFQVGTKLQDGLQRIFHFEFRNR